MNLETRYLGHSEVQALPGGAALRLAPNLARPKVFYDGEVVHAVRFREAISALHDVVVGDLRVQKKDRTAYRAWQASAAAREQQYRADVLDQSRRAELARIEPGVPPGLRDAFRAQHGMYWHARTTWAAELARHDPELFRHLVPCDPVVTVAPDVVFFECFAKDESSYGCLLVERDAFRGEGAAGLGTTNVDYSLALYDHFQTLRSYRATRLVVDPTGFEVAVDGGGAYREEKIELPPSWLRGFGQIQAAMALPARRVTLPVEAVYSLLAYLKRHRERTGPRSIRFRFEPGRDPVMLLDPWGVAIPCRDIAGAACERPEEIKVWGRRRLQVLARLLPLCERVEVALLGSGLPSVWVAHMGEMRFVLALSGWTANDWTAGSNLELLAGTFKSDPAVVQTLAIHLRDAQRATLADLARVLPSTPRDVLLGSLFRLARQGQVMYDFGAGVYRWRQVMPVALSDALLGPENPELVEGRRAWRERQVHVLRDERLADGGRVLVGVTSGTQCEAVLTADDAMTKAKCGCSYFHRRGLRAGPCRHLLALRLAAQSAAAASGAEL